MGTVVLKYCSSDEITCIVGAAVKSKCMHHQVFFDIANTFPLTEAMNVFPIQKVFLNEAA
jgi:hypothetical protein